MMMSVRVTLDPDICHGKPSVRGLRYLVETLLELLAALSYAAHLTHVKRMDRLAA